MDHYSEDAYICSLGSLVRDVFCALSVACALYAIHRLAGAVLLGARISALCELGEAYTPEEREMLIHRIKLESLGR